MNESSESSRDESGNNEMHPLSIEEVSDSFLDNPAPSTDESSFDSNGEYDSNSNNSISPMSISERISLTISLWKYMVPLFVVYATEYAMQSGIWTAIGFPVDSASARNSFYVASNWIYQLGVFLSRSSGAFFTAPVWLLWLMPLLQTVNLIFFYFVAMYKILYNYVLLLPAFFVGLLGGAVYVSGYQRINKDMPLSLREIALSTSSLADSCGILLADVSGLFIQACIYQHHEIDGALVKCPI
jgi:battenin